MRIVDFLKVVVIFIVELKEYFRLLINRHAFAEEPFLLQTLLLVVEEVKQHFEDYWSAGWADLLRIAEDLRIHSFPSIPWSERVT